MKLLYLTEDYLYSKVHNNLLCKLLDKDSSLVIHVFSPVRKVGEHGIENTYRKHERLIVHSPVIDIPLWMYRVLFWAKIRCKVRLIEKHVPIQEIDAIHAATLYTEGGAALKLKEKYGVPCFVSMRGTDSVFYAKKMPHLWHIGIKVIKNANQLACVTPCIKEKMMQVWQHQGVKDIISKADVVNNGIDTIWLDNLSVEPREMNNPIKVLYIGRFDSNKNVYRLIKAITALRDKYDVRLTIVGGVGGNDEEHEIVMKEVGAHKDYIEYLGAIYDKQKLMQFVRHCDIFAMVSHSETFGLVYVECLTQGLPILYSKGTGFDGMYPDGCVGYSVNSYSEEDIASGLNQIIENYTKLRENICQLDFKRYSWDYTSQKYLEYYDSIKCQKILVGVGKFNIADCKQFIKYCLNSMCHLKYCFGNNSIPFNTFIRHNVSLRRTRVGKYCYIGENSALNHVQMGNYCSIAPNVMIGGMEHSYWAASTSARLSDEGIADRTTTIGNDVWIGTQCCIKQGVTIGDGAVIGAQSLVTSDVPAYSIVFGSPARIHKFRFSDEIINKIRKTKYWRNSPKTAKYILSNLKVR